MSVEALARSVLYEGYALYPYRASALKNAHRTLIGTIEPFGDAQVECLIQGDAPLVEARLHYLRLEDGREESFAGAGRFARASVEVDLTPCAPGVFRVRARVESTTESL